MRILTSSHGNDLTGIDTRRWSPHPAVAFGVAVVAHFLAARFAELWTIDTDTAQPFWLASGVTIGLALASPVRVRPLVVIGGVIGQVLNTWWFLDASGSDLVGDALANGVEMAVGVAVLGWWFAMSGRTGRSSWTIAAFGLCFVVSAIGAVIAALWFDPSAPASFVFRWAMGDGLGIAAVGAFFLIPSGPVSWRIGAEADAGPVELVASCAAISGLVAWSFSTATPVLFLVVAALMWLSVRFGPAPSVPMAVLISVIGCIITVRERGPFSDIDDGLVYLQAFNATLIFSTLVVGRYVRAADEARRRSEALLIALPDLVSVRRVAMGDRADDAPVTTVEQVSGSLGSTELDERFLAAIAAIDPGALAPTAASDPSTVPVSRIDLPDGGDESGELHVEHRTVAIDTAHSVTLSRDISDQVDLWRRARAAELRWRRLATSAYEGYLEVDEAGIVVEATERLGEMLDADVEDLLGRPFRQLLDRAALARIEPHIRRIQSGRGVTFETPYVSRAGRRQWALVSAEPTLSSGGEVRGAIVFAADVTEMHEAIEGRTIAELALATVEERERRRIARALHDGPLQSLVAISYQLNALRHGGGDETTPERLEELTLDALRRMRGSLEDLAPVAVEFSGLVEAFHALVARFDIDRSGPQVTIEDTTGALVPEGLATPLYRIGSEAVVNAILHAGADSISVIISADGSGARLDVIDDGSGFDHGAAGNDDDHLGLRAMRERTRERGGTIDIAQVVPHGTQVTIRLPDTRIDQVRS